MLQEDVDELNEYFAKEETLHEKVQTIIGRLDISVRRILSTMQMIHCESGFKNMSDVCLESRTHLELVKKDIAELQKVLTKFDFYKLVDVWQHTFKRLVFLVSLLIYLEEDRLVTPEECAEIVGLFQLPIEDEVFIYGLVGLSKELNRLATNCVTYEDYNRPARILDFVNKLYTCALTFDIDEDEDDQSTLKNVDYIRNNLRSIEKVVYSLSIRKLLD